MMKKVAVILSGCGFMDGSEIHEATLTLLALDLAGAVYQAAAPNVEQSRLMDHFAREPVAGTRNVLVEAARIARGKIEDASTLKADDFDAVVIPGGFGAANNLSTFATEGVRMKVQADVGRFLVEMHRAGKPMAGICIAPPLLAWTMKKCGVTGARITIGNDKATANAIRELGQEHVDCAADDCVVDPVNKLVSTPAYMTAKGIAEMWQGLKKSIDELLKL